MMKNEELVSVIIPTYNREKYIKRAVESVLNQTYNNLELIVVDDGSTDNTLQVLSEINDSRLNVIKQSNRGACIARNNGINYAHGSYIAFNDSDDVWHNNKLKEQINVFKKNNVDIIFCEFCMKNKEFSKRVKYDYSPGKIEHMKNVLGITTQTLIFKSEILKNNKFDSELPRFQEFELLLRLMHKYKFYYLDLPLVDKYDLTDSISNNVKKLVTAINIILKKYPNLNKEDPIVYEALYENVYSQAKINLKAGNKKNSRELLNITLLFANNNAIYGYRYIRNNIFLFLTPLIKRILGK